MIYFFAVFVLFLGVWLPGVRGSVAEQSCNLDENHECYVAVRWAMESGVSMRSEWFPDLDASSTFEEFQSFFHRTEPDICPPPCKGQHIDFKRSVANCSAVPTGSVCYNTVMEILADIADEDAQYLGLNKASSFVDVQRFIHETNSSACPSPCASEATDSLVRDECGTPVAGDPCHRSIRFAQERGIVERPEWFEGLKEGDSFETIQNWLFKRDRDNCKRPCVLPAAPLTVMNMTPQANTGKKLRGSSQTCEPALFSRRRRDSSRGCSCRRRSGSQSLRQGWSCVGNSIAHCGSNCSRSDSEISIRLMTYNVYYAGVKRRVSGISKTVAEVQPDIAVFTELYSTKFDIMRESRERTGRNYIFCDDGPQEKYWDGDIMYDADIWRHREDGVEPLGRGRGLSWGRFRHRETNQELLVYGIHPLRPYNEHHHLRNAMSFGRHLEQMEAWPRAPVVIMGDFNAWPGLPSMRCYAGEKTESGGEHCELPTSFSNTFYESGSRRRSNTHRNGGHIDHILVENKDPPVFRSITSQIYTNAPGNSDHYPIWADVMLKVS